MRSRGRVPVITQFAEAECTLCTAAMILSYYGSRNTVACLRREYETGRDGLSLSRLAQLLRDRGMQVRIFQGGPRALVKLPTPFIAYWENCHVVVVERIRDREVTVVDPALGRRRLSWDEFAGSYSGLVLEPRPGPEFAPDRTRQPSVWKLFLGHAVGARRRFAAVVLLSLLVYAAGLVIPLLTERLVDSSGLGRAEGWQAIALVIGVPAAGYLLFSVIRAWVMSRLVTEVGRSLMQLTFSKLLSLPFTYFANRTRGELVYRLSSVASVRDLIAGQLSGFLVDVGVLGVVFGYLFVRTPLMGFATMGVFVAMVAVSVVTYRPIKSLTDLEISETTKGTGLQLEALSSIEVLKACGVTESFYADWARQYEEIIRLGRRRMLVQGTVSGATGTVQAFGPVAVLAIGLLQLEAVGGLGAVVAAQGLAMTALGTAASLAGFFSQMVMANAQVDRLSDIVQQPVPDPIFGADDTPLRGRVEVRRLGFTYPGATAPTLSDVSFTVEPGKRLAVVGATGSGKSTLARLLLGLYPPAEGEIRFDGRPLQEIAAGTFHDGVALVPQETLLSNRSIAANIDFRAGRPDLRVAEEAGTLAELGDEIAAMPLGYHTPVSEMGNSLSGGQRQRIALARALARRPKVLVLDEATSSLDTATEAKIGRALGSLSCTQIVIAHRLSTVKDADEIVVLRAGRVVQRGKHDELVAIAGPYRELVAAQVDLRA